MIRLVPDPVVVASTGPLPSATLHEITASFRHECRNALNDRTGEERCQGLMPGGYTSLLRAPSGLWRCHSFSPQQLPSAPACFAIMKRWLTVAVHTSAEVVELADTPS